MTSGDNAPGRRCRDSFEEDGSMCRSPGSPGHSFPVTMCKPGRELCLGPGSPVGVLLPYRQRALIGVANAEQVVVYEGPAESSQSISADFAVNRQLGRAWVDVQVQTTQIGSEPVFVAPIERQVARLYCDAEQKHMLYRTATGLVFCPEDTVAQL